MSTVDFLVHAGPHARKSCPLIVNLPTVEKTPPPGVKIARENGAEILAQVLESCPGWLEASEGCLQVAFVLPQLEANGTAKLTAHFGDYPAPPWAGLVEVIPAEPGQVDVRVMGELLTTFHYLDNPARPCFFPLHAPGGVRVTRSWPIQNDVPGETQDHPHHRSFWVAHGDVNGTDNWSEQPGHAYQENCDFAVSSGPVLGMLAAVNNWTDQDRVKVLEETRLLTAYALNSGGRLFDFDVTFTATDCDVCFGDTKEGGILALRVAPAMDGDHGGRIENSYGGIGEAECWGKRAQWCDYSGEIDGERVGIAVFDHPRSFRHPTYWHVRDYGMYTANPFGWHDFHADPAFDGSYLLSQGASLRFHYRVYLHRGGTAEAGVAARYHDYANPPEVVIV